jgi:hypothetical protein
MKKVSLVLVALLAHSAVAVHGQLFAPLALEFALTGKARPLSPGITHTLEVAVNASVLSAGVFDVELDGVRYTAKGHLESKSLEHQFWSGSVEDGVGGEGSMVLTRFRGGTWGQINTPVGTWVVETRDGHTFLHRVDVSQGSGCGLGDELQLADLDFEMSDARRPALARAIPAGEPQITIRAFYTPERLAAVGGIENLTGLTLSQVDIANRALANTGAGLVPFRLADLQPTSHTELGDIRRELPWFASDPTVKRWRDYPTPPVTARADLVVLLVHNNGPVASGLAMLGGIDTPANAYAVIGNWEFSSATMGIIAHELGHLLGLLHDQPSTTFTPPGYESAHGWFYQIPSGEWRSDVMTYPNVCPGGCHIQWQYSNPFRLDSGVPTGEVNIANAYGKLPESTRFASLYRITDLFGTTWARHRAKAKQLNVRVEIPAGTSTSAKLYKGPSKDGRCVGASFGTVTFNGPVATSSFRMPKKPGWVCLETVQAGGTPGTVRFFPVAPLP